MPPAQNAKLFSDYLQEAHSATATVRLRRPPRRRREVAAGAQVAQQSAFTSTFLTSTFLTSTTGTFSTTTRLRRSRRLALRATSTVLHSQALTSALATGLAGACALGASPAKIEEAKTARARAAIRFFIAIPAYKLAPKKQDVMHIQQIHYSKYSPRINSFLSRFLHRDLPMQKTQPWLVEHTVD